jgi:hypothetical protein
MYISSVIAIMLLPFAVQSFVVFVPSEATTPTSLLVQGSKSSSSNSNDDETEIIEQSKAEFGVSYIGGDPCGSKYNDDPFDVQVQKPGMPDDMKTRIQALVDKKVAEEKEKDQNQADQ